MNPLRYTLLSLNSAAAYADSDLSIGTSYDTLFAADDVDSNFSDMEPNVRLCYGNPLMSITALSPPSSNRLYKHSIPFPPPTPDCGFGGLLPRPRPFQLDLSLEHNAGAGGIVINLSSDDDIETDTSQPINLSRKRLLRDAIVSAVAGAHAITI